MKGINISDSKPNNNTKRSEKIDEITNNHTKKRNIPEEKYEIDDVEEHRNDEDGKTLLEKMQIHEKMLKVEL